MKIKKLINNTKKGIIGNHAIHYKNYQIYDKFYVMIFKCIILGILGLIFGVTEIDGLDGNEIPTTFIATIVKV